MDYAKLGLTKKRFDDAVKKSDIRKLGFEGMSYWAFRERVGKLGEGSVAFGDGTVIRGFGKIRRALVLEAALKKNFRGGFVVEEKLDGYNVRAVRVGGKVFAITRGGLICPFSTKFLREKVQVGKFLEENNLVLCGELVGDMSPYVKHFYPEAPKLDLFVFDIQAKGSGRSLKVDERGRLCEKYSLRQAPRLGEFDRLDMKRLWSILGKLERDGREGVVIKSRDSRKAMKYTVSNANQGEVGLAFRYPFDHGIEFWFRRLVREAFQSCEMGEDRKELEERGRKLGIAILGSMRGSIEKVRGGEELTEDVVIEEDPKVLKQFLGHLKKLGVRFEHEWVGATEVKIKRIHRRSQDKIKNYLGGSFASD